MSSITIPSYDCKAFGIEISRLQFQSVIWIFKGLYILGNYDMHRNCRQIKLWQSVPYVVEGCLHFL